MAKYHKAIENTNKRLTIAIDAGDKQEQENAYCSLGNAYQLLEEYHKAIEYQEKYLSIVREIGYRQGERNAYCSLGNAYQLLREYHKAVECQEKALSIAREFRDRQGEGDALYCNLGNAYHLSGKYHKAIEYHKKYLRIARAIDDRQDEGNAHCNLGIAYRSLGKYDKAIECQEKALSIAREFRDRRGEGNAYCNLGNVYHSLGEYHKAIKYQEKYLRIAMKIGDRTGEGNAYCNLGNAHQLLREYCKAINYQEKALSIAIKIGDRQGEGDVYCNLGNVYQLLREYHKAIEYQEKHLIIAIQIGDRQGVGDASGNLGNAYYLLGEYHKAIKYQEKSLSICRKVGDTHGEAKSHLSIGIFHNFSRNPNRDLVKAKENYKESIECFDKLFDELQENDQSKIAFFETFTIAYELLSDLYIETKEPEEAMLVCERGRARALEDLLNMKYSVSEKNGIKKHSLKHADVKNISSNCKACILFYDVRPKIMIVHNWILTPKTQEIVFYNGTSDNDEALSQVSIDGLKDDQVAVVSSFQHLVEESFNNMAVRDGIQCEDRSLEILECEDRDSKPSLAVFKSTKLDATVAEELSRCIYPFDQAKPLETLFYKLITPVLPKLVTDEIVIVPDGHLFTVPFPALQDPNTGQFLSEMKRIRLAPSLTALKILEESPDNHHHKTGALIVGNPEVGTVKFKGKEKTITPLPGAEREAEEISKILRVEPLIGKHATKETILEKLKVGVSVIHFAAHGSTNGQIFLAPSSSSATDTLPEEKDYMLTIKEVQKSGLRAQLVVLSCCHSGRGEIKSEGVVGMTRAFLAAGARAVVASLWAIDDNATKEFMLKFYSHLKNGDSASTSLHQAMKEMRDKTTRYNKPKYWAAFFLIGDDVTISV